MVKLEAFYIIMKIHIFRQPLFYFAKRLIHPTLNRIGITPNRIDIYNNLWNVSANATINGGFASGLYTTWHLRKLLKGKTNIDNFNSVVGRYVNIDNTMVDTINTLTQYKYGEVIPFVRQLNYMLAVIIGNIGFILVKNLLRTTFLGGLTTIFTSLTGCLSILWIPSLADISALLTFALKIKNFADYFLAFLPGNWYLPIPDWLSDKLRFNLMNSALWFLSTPFLKFVLPNFGSAMFDSLSTYFFGDLINHIRLFYLPIKTLLFRSCWYLIDKFIYYDINGNFAGINWNKWFNYIYPSKDNINKNLQPIFKDLFIQRVLKYLFDEFNLFG